MLTSLSSPWLPLRDDEKWVFLRSGFTSITMGVIRPRDSSSFCCIIFVAVAVRPIIIIGVLANKLFRNSNFPKSGLKLFLLQRKKSQLMSKPIKNILELAQCTYFHSMCESMNYSIYVRVQILLTSLVSFPLCYASLFTPHVYNYSERLSKVKISQKRLKNWFSAKTLINFRLHFHLCCCCSCQKSDYTI